MSPRHPVLAALDRQAAHRAPHRHLSASELIPVLHIVNSDDTVLKANADAALKQLLMCDLKDKAAMTESKSAMCMAIVKLNDEVLVTPSA